MCSLTRKQWYMTCVQQRTLWMYLFTRQHVITFLNTWNFKEVTHTKEQHILSQVPNINFLHNKTCNVHIVNTEARSCNHCCSRKANKYYIFWVCICSLRQPACNADVPYCHLWHTWFYNILPNYLINAKIFKKWLLNMKCVFWFSLQLLSETFLS